MPEGVSRHVGALVLLRLYLDMCCLCRPFDVHPEAKVKLEGESMLSIFNLILSGRVELVWSDILSAENAANRNVIQRTHVGRWASRSVETIGYSPDIESMSASIRESGIKRMDSLHVSCAIAGGCHFFVTTDRRLLNYRSELVYICDPVECLRILESLL
jgi:hypothetical protein